MLRGKEAKLVKAGEAREREGTGRERESPVE